MPVVIAEDTAQQIVAWGWLDRGAALMQQARLTDAIECFDQAIGFYPQDWRSHWNRAICLLALGEYREGVEELDHRWKLFDWGWGYLSKDIYRVAAVEQWTGQPLKGKHLLHYHEQGNGDCIMMARYLPMIRALGCKLTVLTLPSLLRLIERFAPDHIITALPEDLSVFDYRCAALMPMQAFGTTIKSIPPAPFLKADFRREKGTVGIVWAGMTQRRFSLAKFITLLDCQKKYRVKSLVPGPVDYGIEPLAVRDFEDTMQEMAKLEHIVTIDSAVANLAGAMGHPSAHVILPFLQDWRWYHADKWFPTLKTYRQPADGNDWSVPFARVRAALQC
jgi:hypothetical protein